MSRPPHARIAILKAAEDIVRDIGAANLTFDELVRRSGITRGGITYHFPTKDALLQAIVENDVGQWHECLAEKRARQSGPAADLLAYIESCTEPDEATSRLVAGLLSVAAGSSTLNAPVREYFVDHHERVCRQSPDPTLAIVLSLAVDGLFWQETLGLSPLSPSEREAVVARLLELATATTARRPA